MVGKRYCRKVLPFFFLLFPYLPASGQAVVTVVVPSPPPVLDFIFFRAKSLATTLFVDSSSSVANSPRPRAFRESSCAQENIYRSRSPGASSRLDRPKAVKTSFCLSLLEYALSH